MRERQAEFSRNEILKAARRLFAERGFTKTTVRDIAQAAGVSAQTVYDSIGSKQAVVARLNDLIDSEAGIGAIIGPVAASRDPQQVAALSARITRAMIENCGDIIRAIVTGAAAEPEIQAVLDDGHRRHLEGARTVVGLLQGMDALVLYRPRRDIRNPRGDHRLPVRPHPPRELRLDSRPHRGMDDNGQPRPPPRLNQADPNRAALTWARASFSPHTPGVRSGECPVFGVSISFPRSLLTGGSRSVFPEAYGPGSVL